MEYIKEDSQYFSNNINFDLFDLILKFLNKNPKIIDSLNSSSKTLIKNKVNKNNKYIFLAWFLNESLPNHLEFLKDKDENFFNVEIEINTIIELNKNFINQGLLSESKELLIMMFGFSNSFNQADFRFYRLIEPILKDFNLLELTELVKKVNENGQINTRGLAKSSNRLIKEQVVKLEQNFDFSPFSNFHV